LNAKPSFVKKSTVSLRSFTGKFTKIWVVIIFVSRRMKEILKLLNFSCQESGHLRWFLFLGYYF
jgi:hypothetical protein